jgi:nucleoside-diphosphate-sugar epimerase
MMRVAVFGASGFLGSTLVERLWQAGNVEVVPIIHSSGNAARLARFGRPLISADVLQPESLDRALAKCTHVVNCSRGPAEVMLKGLANMLEASGRSGVGRFVHVSSVAVYGEGERASTLLEDERPTPTPNTYGWTKLLQDQMIEKAAARGLSCAVLCPPNISGTYSAFLTSILQSIRNRDFALVAGGSLPCELVDVENLVHAIRLALQAADSAPQRVFVTDGSETTWSDVANALAPLADVALPLPSISLDEARQRVRTPATETPSILAAAKHLVSSEVRSALKRDPWVAAAERSLKTSIRKVGPLNRALRRKLEKRPGVAKVSRSPRFSEKLMEQQLRNVRYSQARARGQLAYAPIVSPGESMEAFRRWYREIYGWNDGFWSLTRHLYD